MAQARIAFGICLLTGLATAVEPLKLEDYVPADFHRRYLSVEPGLSFNGYATEREGDSSRRESGNTVPSAILRMNHGTQRFSQDRRWKIECGSDFSLQGDEYRSEDSRQNVSGVAYSEYRDNSVFHYSAYFRLFAQQYLRGRFFLAPSVNLDWDHTPSNATRSAGWSLFPSQSGSIDSNQFYRSRTEWESDRFRIAGNARLEAGFGRIQDVRFAEVGLFVLDRIAETTGKPMALDAQGMRDMEAAVEARRKQRGFMDYRAADIYDLETIAAFLQERRGGEALPARAVLAMADEWHNAYHDRASGWEVKAYPFLQQSWYQNELEENKWNALAVFAGSPDADPDSLARLADAGFTSPRRTRYRQFESLLRTGVGVSAEWKRPWRRFWQMNAVAYGKASRDRKEIGDKSRSDSAGVDGFNRIQYLDMAYPAYDCGLSLKAEWFPNSRTALGVGTGVGIWGSMDYLDTRTNQTPLSGPVPERSITNISPSITASGNYWLNPRMTATFYATYGWYWIENQGALENLMDGGEPLGLATASGGDLRMNAGLKYFLF